MFYPNDFVTRNIKTQQMNEYLKQAEKDRLLAQLNRNQPHWLIERMRSASHVLGHLLVAAGRRLARAGVERSQVRMGHVTASK